MEVKIKLFATLKDRAGAAQITLSVDPEITVKTLLAGVGQAYPTLEPALPSVLVAVNQAYAGPETLIRPGDEVALFPPVSGGSNVDLPHPTYFSITTDEVDLGEVIARLMRPDVGAVVTFTGAVRGTTDRDGLPPQTLYLEYESYQEMAEVKMSQIAHEIWQRWPLVKGVAIVQRVGKLEIGEMTTLVACAAGHRDQGVFEAARYGIDRLKEIVPVWKKEVGRDRSVWVEGHYRPTQEDNL
jgi:molybdopterin converting factor subunit 1